MGMFARIAKAAGWDSGSGLRRALIAFDSNFQLIEPSVKDSGAADYVPLLGERMFTRSRATAQTFTLPTNAAVAYPIGVELTVIQSGAGALTFVAPGGGAINIAADKTLVANGQNAVVRLRKVAANTWQASGDLAAISPFVTSNAADYIPALSDRVIARSLGTAQTLTLPQNSAVAFPIGTQIDIVQTGAGALTVQAGAGATVTQLATKTLVVAGQHGVVRATKVAANAWEVSGDLTVA
jgi:hypothetical protein